MILFFLAAALSAASLADDPEILMTVPQIIERWGYVAERHHAVTNDGYILELHRIPFGKNGTNGTKRPVVFLQHGLLCSSSNWVTNLPNESAAFMFADAGFDVWMGNNRGNTYSNKHEKYTIKDEKFWKFTWDQLAEQDLPTMIDYALEATEQESLYYVGHSQGTLTMFATTSENYAFSRKIKKFFALAPIGSVEHIKGAMEIIAKDFGFVLESWEGLFGSKDFLPSGPLMDILSETICKDKRSDKLCDNFLFLLSGPESHQFNESRTDVYTSHTPAGTSSMNIVHWVQMVKKGIVAKFDYGDALKNHAHYGTFTPPKYDFTKINVPIYLYWSESDFLADQKDITGWLIPRLNIAAVKENNHVIDFNHFDFTWGMRAAEEVYKPIIKTCLDDWKH